MDISDDFSNFIKDGSSKIKELHMIEELENKISNLEKILLKHSYNNTTDMQYNNLPNEIMQPLGSYDKTFNNKWENTYTLLNTDKWRPPLNIAPVCKQEKKCPICPSLTNGYPSSVLEYDNSRYIMNPDNISLDYIKKLNTNNKT